MGNKYEIEYHLFLLYYNNMKIYITTDSRPYPANMQPEDFDPCLCTHVLYSFVDLRNNQLQLSETDKSIQLFLMTNG